MGMRPLFDYLLLTLVACAACGSRKAAVVQPEGQGDTLTAFFLPAIPLMLDDPELRADYLTRHYWDCTDFADTNYIHHPEITEQAWVDFIDLLRIVPRETADAAIRNAFAQAEKEKKCYLYLAGLADKYLYDPNSPMRHEEHYISVLDLLLASSVLDDAEKIRPQARRTLAQRNRLGTRALDFVYTLASGQTGTLHSLRSPYTLLFINNPGCQACTDMINGLQQAPAIGQAFDSGKLRILSLYPDEEPEEWRHHLAEFPVGWINAYDRGSVIKEQNLYDLKAIPTLYLLDKEKTVLLKDATIEEVEQYVAGLR